MTKHFALIWILVWLSILGSIIGGYYLKAALHRRILSALQNYEARLSRPAQARHHAAALARERQWIRDISLMEEGRSEVCEASLNGEGSDEEEEEEEEFNHEEVRGKIDMQAVKKGGKGYRGGWGRGNCRVHGEWDAC